MAYHLAKAINKAISRAFRLLLRHIPTEQFKLYVNALEILNITLHRSIAPPILIFADDETTHRGAPAHARLNACHWLHRQRVDITAC